MSNVDRAALSRLDARNRPPCADRRRHIAPDPIRVGHPWQVAVNVELREESGRVVERAGGDGLMERLRRAADSGSPCPRWIDPYGDTAFNHMQAALVRELETARPSAPASDVESFNRLIELARAGAEGVHLYVWCIGD
jgi:hypothetical protein